MIIFICSTPYQILVAINIKERFHKDDQCEVYILDHFNNAEIIKERLSKTNIFSAVRVVHGKTYRGDMYPKLRLLRYFKKIKDNLNYKEIVKVHFGFGEKIYDHIYFTYPDTLIQLAVKELSERNSKMKVHMYEDGLGGYNSDILVTSIYKKLFNKITSFGKSIDKYNSIMVFKPELYSGSTDIPKIRIPSINKGDLVLKNKINEVFIYEGSQEIIEKIIFLEQPMNHIPGLNEKIRGIANKILKGDYIIKLHPRSNTKDYDKYNIYKNNGTPWEIISLNNDIEEKILISYYSTASISNKIIFDKEPIIIFLFDMEELKEVYQIPEETKEFIEKFKKTYRDPSRILIAKNIVEMQEYLSNIMQNSGGKC